MLLRQHDVYNHLDLQSDNKTQNTTNYQKYNTKKKLQQIDIGEDCLAMDSENNTKM